MQGRLLAVLGEHLVQEGGLADDRVEVAHHKEPHVRARQPRAEELEQVVLVAGLLDAPQKPAEEAASLILLQPEPR